MTTDRISKTEYYLNIAAAVAQRSTCIRRQYGAVIVNNDEIIATGYNGSPRGEENCCESGNCWRELNNVPHGERYEVLQICSRRTECNYFSITDENDRNNDVSCGF